jgi:hypothetical protein
MLLSVRGHRRSAAVQRIRSNRRGVYFRGLPRLGRTNPRASVVDRSWLANLSDSLRSGDSRANLKSLDREQFRLDFHLKWLAATFRHRVVQIAFRDYAPSSNCRVRGLLRHSGFVRCREY